jgi:hypothetical protein
MVGKIATLLLQLCVLGPGLLQDGDVRVGVRPELQEVLVGCFGFDGVTGGGVGAGQSKGASAARGQFWTMTRESMNF